MASAYRTYWNPDVAAPWTTLWLAIRSLAEHFDALVIISLVALIFFLAVGVAERRRIEDRCFSVAVIGHLVLRMCWPRLRGAPRALSLGDPGDFTAVRW